MKIGIFDSGLGGMNVLKQLIEKYPNNEYIFYGDTINLPYGEKSKQQLIDISTKIVNFFEQLKVNIIIVACGTVSSNAFKELKLISKIPIINILDYTINYINKRYKKIGVIGTKGTIESKYFEKNLKNLQVQTLATPLLVPLIESNKIDTLEFNQVLNKYLEKFKNIEVLVLGCTHYPLFKNKVKFKTIDMGEILVNNLKLTNNSKFNLIMYFSLLNNDIIKNVNKMFGKCQIIERVL